MLTQHQQVALGGADEQAVAGGGAGCGKPVQQRQGRDMFSCGQSRALDGLWCAGLVWCEQAEALLVRECNQLPVMMVVVTSAGLMNKATHPSCVMLVSTCDVLGGRGAFNAFRASMIGRACACLAASSAVIRRFATS